MTCDDDIAKTTSGMTDNVPAPGAEPSVDVHQRPVFPYLDGLRGLAALWVVSYHAFLYSGREGEASSHAPFAAAVLEHGFLGVPIFIVLSGYVLTLPTLSHMGGPALPKGVAAFLYRRGRRILPPYYAALAVTTILVVSVPLLRHPGGTQWDTKLPVTLSTFLGHVALLQDVNPHWFGKINGPLWSVAVEWHIYLAMALVLIPVWRRWGTAALLAVAVPVSFLPLLLGVATFAHPWLVIVFCLGMLSAQGTMKSSARPPRWATPAAGATIGLSLTTSAADLWTPWLPECLIGAGVALILWSWSWRRQLSMKDTLIMRVLASRPAMRLGLVSYSVYLMHSPLLALANLMSLKYLNLGTYIQVLVMVCGAAPLAVACCILFYWLVERHFLNARQAQLSHHQSTDKLRRATPVACARDRESL